MTLPLKNGTQCFFLFVADGPRLRMSAVTQPLRTVSPGTGKPDGIISMPLFFRLFRISRGIYASRWADNLFSRGISIIKKSHTPAN